MVANKHGQQAYSDGSLSGIYRTTGSNYDQAAEETKNEFTHSAFDQPDSGPDTQ